MVEEIKISYSDFIRLCRVKDPKDWEPGIEVMPDGVWIIPPKDDDLLTPGERATLSENPQKDLSKPALPFPCSLNEFEKFLEWLAGTVYAYVYRSTDPNDPEKEIENDLKDFIQEQRGANEVREEEEALVKSVWPEVERLYKKIKAVGFKETDVESKLKDQAKNEVKTNHADYIYIKSRHLNSKQLFTLNPGQEKRDFIGQLLQIIAKDHGIKKTNYQRLYKTV